MQRYGRFFGAARPGSAAKELKGGEGRRQGAGGGGRGGRAAAKRQGGAHINNISNINNISYIKARLRQGGGRGRVAAQGGGGEQSGLGAVRRLGQALPKTPMAPKTPMPPMSAGRKVFKNVKNVGGCVGGLKKLAKFAGGMVSPLRRCSICRLCSSTDRIEVS